MTRALFYINIKLMSIFFCRSERILCEAAHTCSQVLQVCFLLQVPRDDERPSLKVSRLRTAAWRYQAVCEVPNIQTLNKSLHLHTSVFLFQLSRSEERG